MVMPVALARGVRAGGRVSIGTDCDERGKGLMWAVTRRDVLATPGGLCRGTQRHCLEVSQCDGTHALVDTVAAQSGCARAARAY